MYFQALIARETDSVISISTHFSKIHPRSLNHRLSKYLSHEPSRLIHLLKSFTMAYIGLKFSKCYLSFSIVFASFLLPLASLASSLGLRFTLSRYNCDINADRGKNESRTAEDHILRVKPAGMCWGTGGATHYTTLFSNNTSEYIRTVSINTYKVNLGGRWYRSRSGRSCYN